MVAVAKAPLRLVIPGGAAILQIPDELMADFRAFAPDWPESDDAPIAATLTVRRQAEGWSIEGPDHAAPDQLYSQGYELANALLGAMTACYLARDPRLVCLHAAAVDLGEAGLVVLLGQNFAGKSTLATALAAQGLPLFCDDRLLVNWEWKPEGLALGAATKLRLPLPPGADATMQAFVDRHAVWRTEDFAILDGAGVARAWFGARRRLAGLVLLERLAEDTVPVLSALSRPDAVRALLQQHFAPHLSTVDLLRACTAVATAIPAWRYRYSGCSDAAAALLAGLAGEIAS